MARRGVVTAVVVGVVAAGAGLAFALQLTLTPTGGGPGSSFTAEVPCPVPAQFYVVSLDRGAPPGTLVPTDGVESSPGTWRAEFESGHRDMRVTAQCGDDFSVGRYDVDEPVLMPGPTFANIGAWRPELEGTTVVGTDCEPGSQVRVTFDGPNGAAMATVSTDRFGDWQAAIPASIPDGPVTVTATCGDLVYEPLTFTRRGAPAPTPAPSEPTPTPPAPAPSAPKPPSARPVPGSANYTG